MELYDINVLHFILSQNSVVRFPKPSVYICQFTSKLTLPSCRLWKTWVYQQISCCIRWFFTFILLGKMPQSHYCRLWSQRLGDEFFGQKRPGAVGVGQAPPRCLPKFWSSGGAWALNAELWNSWNSSNIFLIFPLDDVGKYARYPPVTRLLPARRPPGACGKKAPGGCLAGKGRVMGLISPSTGKNWPARAQAFQKTSWPQLRCPGNFSQIPLMAGNPQNWGILFQPCTGCNVTGA